MGRAGPRVSRSGGSCRPGRRRRHGAGRFVEPCVLRIRREEFVLVGKRLILAAPEADVGRRPDPAQGRRRFEPSLHCIHPRSHRPRGGSPCSDSPALILIPEPDAARLRSGGTIRLRLRLSRHDRSGHRRSHRPRGLLRRPPRPHEVLLRRLRVRDARRPGRGLRVRQGEPDRASGRVRAEARPAARLPGRLRPRELPRDAAGDGRPGPAGLQPPPRPRRCAVPKPSRSGEASSLPCSPTCGS